jgi:hypothetical protein
MTASDDFSRDDSSQVPPESIGDDGQPGTGLPSEEEAAWLEIVANYGERARLAEDWSGPADPGRDAPRGPGPAPRSSWFDRSFLDSQPEETGQTGKTGSHQGDGSAAERAARREEEHYVPPPPPPLPKGTPARRLAWLGVLLPPVLMFVAVLVRWPMPAWLSLLLVLAFLGGFVFLVATMPRDGRDDWDDGAVV